LDTWWSDNVYDQSLATGCAAGTDTPVCQVTLGADAGSHVYACVAACDAAIDYDAYVVAGQTAAAEGDVVCYASPASSTTLTEDSGDDATGTEAKGAECDAWITETPETGCTDDDAPGDDASDDDYMAYINLC